MNKETVTSASADTNSGGPGRKSLPTIKLGSYDGTTSLETYLAKLENCAEYYGWSAWDRLCHLKPSLSGQADEVLWQLKPGAT